MSDIGQLNVKVGLDSSGFQNGISKLNQEMRKVQSEFKLASTELGKHGSELDKLKVRSDSLTKQKEIQKQRVEALEKAHKNAVETKGKDAKATADLEVKLNQARTQLVQMEQDLVSINREIQVQSSGWYQLGKSLEPVGKSMQDIGMKMESVGKDLTKKVTLPLVGIGAAAVKIGSDFQAEMSKVQAISGATGDELEKLGEKAKEMGSSTKFSASQSAQALNYMAMAGWDTNQMLDGLDGVMMLAAASGENLATVSDIVTDALTAFGMQASDAGGFADLLASASSNANTNIGMLGESFKYVAPIFGSMGYSAEDAALALGLMANAGIKGSQAGTTLRGSITRLAQPTSQAADVISQLGLNMTDASGNMLPFKDVMDQLRVSFANLTQEQQAQYASTLFGQQAMSGMLAIINASEEDYQNLTAATREYSGAAGEMADIMQDNLQGQLTILKSQLEGVAIEIFEILVPHLKTLVTNLQRAVTWFSNLNPATQETIVKIAALAAALGPVLIIGGKIVIGAGTVIGALSKISIALAGKTAAIGTATTAAGGLVAIKGVLAAAFTALTGPIGLAVLAITAITAVGITLWKNWDTIKEKAAELGESISERWNSIRENTTEAWENVKTGISDRWESIKENTADTLTNINENITTGWENIKTSTNERWELIQAGIVDKWEGIKLSTSESLSSIRENVSVSWEKVRGRTNETWEFLKTNTSSAWANIKGTIEENGGGISGVITTYTEGYRYVWSTALSTMDSVTGSKFSAMSDKVSRAFSRVRESIQSGINKLLEWNSQRVENKEATFTNRIRNITENIVSTVTSPIKKNFSGTSYFQGGLTMVGELGPELVELPRASKIYNDYQTNQIIGEGFKRKVEHSGSITVIGVNNKNELQGTVEIIMDRLRQEARM
ncbi:Phage tail length tape-measure protein T [Candidatus Syntrophocurvum alkaliphilum]|uniref:Phage tail length tape-measure protein T n=1 Tax=Candidatus Syntrophocurvum alkaliphilum TaxID=2293317 RepID=A0A6I6D9B4_9FIRM|nr:phage tail tape measure protein [Candidatus Syntrophocurvum alkaliphilum]QGT99498.1 Phage tail length tape-measure protein T [Candidatus Syntrophocurvum alkaliphilum]